MPANKPTARTYVNAHAPASSTGLAGSGFYYMAAPALVAGYGLNKSLQTKKQIEQLMQ
jgi:hypothetical protein